MSETREKASSDEQPASRFEREALPHLPRLYPAALRMTDDPEHAGELVQETYARAYRDFPHQGPDTNLRAWLYRILVNLHHATHRRDQAAADQVPTDRANTGYGEPTGTLVEREDLERLPSTEVIRALHRLPPNDRTAVYLADVEGFGYHDIAQITQTPVNTVTRRLHDGRRLLRRVLEHSAGSGTH